MFCCPFHFSFSHVTQRRVALHFTPLFELIYLSVLPINAWGVWAYPYFSLETTLPVSWLASDCAAAAGRQRFYMKCEKCRERVARKVVVVAWSQRTKQNKTKYNPTTTKSPTRPEIAAAQRRADPQPHSSSGCGLQRWWLRGTLARSDDPMTKRRQHTRTCGRLGLAKRRRCRCRCRSVGCGVNDLRPANWLAELWCALRKSQNYCGARRGLGLYSSLI